EGHIMCCSVRGGGGSAVTDFPSAAPDLPVADIVLADYVVRGVFMDDRLTAGGLRADVRPDTNGDSWRLATARYNPFQRGLLVGSLRICLTLRPNRSDCPRRRM